MIVKKLSVLEVEAGQTQVMGEERGQSSCIEEIRLQ